MTQTIKEYAEALFSLATECGAQKEYYDALNTCWTAFHENPEYVDYLSSPAVPKDERCDALQAAFKEAVPEYILSFLCLLCERGRLRAFDTCLKEYEALYLESKRISVAKVVSAVPLSDAEANALQGKLEEQSGHTVRLEFSTDRSLIGGLVVYMDGKIMDGSIKNRLHSVKDVMNR